MKHLKTFEGFNPYDDEPLTRSEEIFGKQTRLEKQFSEIVVNRLVNDDTGYWSTFNALKGEVMEVADENTIKELQHRIVEGENPTEVMNDICSRLQPTKELERLLNKLNNF